MRSRIPTATAVALPAVGGTVGGWLGVAVAPEPDPKVYAGVIDGADREGNCPAEKGE